LPELVLQPFDFSGAAQVIWWSRPSHGPYACCLTDRA